MKRFYQVYTVVCPSGGISAASQERFTTREEAREKADEMLANVEEFIFHTIDGRALFYPSFWAQGVIEKDNG